MKLYAVSDRAWLHDGITLTDQVSQAIAGGITCLQLREKCLDQDAFLAEALEIGQLCRDGGIPFIINDDVDIAIASKADGIHVGQSDMEAGNVRAKIGPGMLLGVSAQTVEQALAAEAAGADYLGVGAVFPTGTKLDADAVSMDTLTAICDAVKIPVVAIGGISESNAMSLAKSGIDGIAVVSAIFAANDIVGATKRLRAIGDAIANRQKHACLTIAGSDCSGGAGIQADLKAMTINGVYAMSAITSLTAQNTTGVTGILEVPTDFLAEQIDAIFTDIRPEAVKIGMTATVAIIETIAERLKFYGATNIVIDPVMVSTSGARLIAEDAVDALKSILLPLATVLTPNIPEAEVLADMKIKSVADMETAAKAIGEKFGCAVLCKGGHALNDANDLLWQNGECTWFNGRRIDNPNTHGTGCTLSSAIAANLAKGASLKNAIAAAKEYISACLAAGLDLGAGSGPMDHAFSIK